MDRAFVADFVDSVHNKPESCGNNHIDFDLSDKNDHVLSALLGDTSPQIYDLRGCLLADKPAPAFSSSKAFDNTIADEYSDRYFCLEGQKNLLIPVFDKASGECPRVCLSPKEIPCSENEAGHEDLGEGGT